MERAKAGELSLLFMDASHFVLGCDFLRYIYCRSHRFVLTFSGRKRYNVFGTIDYVTKKVLTIANDTYITANEVCDMLRKISADYPDRAIHIILDNARYQKCETVRSLAAGLGITLQYIPPYSSNLIERLWKFAKGELRSKYYDNFSDFQNRIDAIIDSTAKENLPKVKKLIGDKLQLFDGMKSVSKNTSETIAKTEKLVA